MGTITDKLSKVLETKSNLKTAIINKGGSIDNSTPFSQYATIIESLPGGITGVTYTDNTLTINKNDELINVNVDSVVNSININNNYEGYLYINTNDNNSIVINSGASAQIENNGTITATNLSAENIKSGVNILGKTGTYETPTETKSVTPTESIQTITPSTGKHLSKVTVEGISSTYVGSGVNKITSLTKSGGTITAPAGYYASALSASVNISDLNYSQATELSGSRSGTTYTVSIAANSYTSSALSKQITPSTLGLTAQAAKTVTPSRSVQTAVASGCYTTGAVKVGAIPSSYVIPSGTKNITSNGTYDITNYASVNVNVESSGGGSGEVVTFRKIFNDYY